jgi:hypothetical protein
MRMNSKQRDEPTTQVAFRFPNSLLKQIDAYRRKLGEQTKGLNVSRADAVRVLVKIALEREVE